MGKGSSAPAGGTALKEQSKESQELFGELRPARGALNDMVLSTLRDPTGKGVPFLEEVSRQNDANRAVSLEQTAESIRRAGLSDTPEGRAILAQQSINIGKAASDDKNAAISSFLEQIPSILQGQAGLAASQGSSAAQTLSQAGLAKMQADSILAQGIGQGVGTAAGYVGDAAYQKYSG